MLLYSRILVKLGVSGEFPLLGGGLFGVTVCVFILFSVTSILGFGVWVFLGLWFDDFGFRFYVGCLVWYSWNCGVVGNLTGFWLDEFSGFGVCEFGFDVVYLV